MLSFRKSVVTAVALSLAVTLPTFAAPTVESSKVPAGSFEKYLPDGANGVVKINVRQFLDSELVKKAGLEKALTSDQAKKEIAVLGFDPMKDIEHIIICTNKDNPDEATVIIQGKFDPAKLAAVADAAAKEKEDCVKIHKTANGKVYEVAKLDDLIKLPAPAAAAGINLTGKSLFFVFPDKGHVVLLGTKDSAEDVLAKAAGKKTTKLANKEMPGLLAKINPKQTVAVALPAPAFLDKAKSITGGFTVTADVKVDVNIATADAATAKELNTTLGDGLKQAQDSLALITLQVKELAPAVDILNSIKLDAKDANIGIKSDIKGDTIEKFLKGAKEFAEKNGLK